MAGVAFQCGGRARHRGVAQLRATIRLGRAVSVRGEALSYREKEHGKRAMEENDRSRGGLAHRRDQHLRGASKGWRRGDTIS
jgi:hypothetical protein